MLSPLALMFNGKSPNPYEIKNSIYISLSLSLKMNQIRAMPFLLLFRFFLLRYLFNTGMERLIACKLQLLPHLGADNFDYTLRFRIRFFGFDDWTIFRILIPINREWSQPQKAYVGLVRKIFKKLNKCERNEKKRFIEFSIWYIWFLKTNVLNRWESK